MSNIPTIAEIRAVRQVALNAYAEAFAKCYPQNKIGVVFAGFNKTTREPQYRVSIDGDQGERPFTLSDLMEATAEFNAKGRQPEPEPFRQHQACGYALVDAVVKNPTHPLAAQVVRVANKSERKGRKAH